MLERRAASEMTLRFSACASGQMFSFTKMKNTRKLEVGREKTQVRRRQNNERVQGRGRRVAGAAERRKRTRCVHTLRLPFQTLKLPSTSLIFFFISPPQYVPTAVPSPRGSPHRTAGVQGGLSFFRIPGAQRVFGLHYLGA